MTFDTRETSIEGGQPGRLYEFRQGLIVWRYTDGDRLVTYATQEFEPAAISDDGRRLTGETSADEFVITAPANLPVVELFRAAPPSTEIEVVVRERHHGEADARIYFTGSIVGVRRKDPQSAQIRCQSDLSSLDRVGLRLGYTRSCTHSLYDRGCKVSAFLYEVPGIVIAISGTTLEAGAWSVPADGYFSGGYIEWPIGGGEFERRGIERHVAVNGRLTIVGGTSGIALGTTVKAYPGCPRTIAVCQSRFANSSNFGGFPHTPGKSPFDGDPIF
jgi:uncharacterized phage protein (TIGR02218 family)